MKTRVEEAKSGITTRQNERNMNKMLHISSFNIGMILEGKYEIKREISRGGMGIVYEAYDNFTNRQVAIKIILGNKIDTLQLKRFQKEIEACARLSHPNVIKIYDAGTYENNPYIVMEYIDGVNIGQYIMQQDKAFGQEDDTAQKRDWKLCAKLIYETALGLEYIHKQKMFHRDIKPTNIIVRSDGSPVIIDLGLVKFNQERSYNLTRSRDIIGTCQYMPMEQVQGKHGKVDARSDVYSLGLVLYELLTEQRAYTGKNATEVFNKIATYYPPLPREINAQIPEVLEEITMHAIEKQKERRYATAQEFADALKQYLDGTTTQTTTQYAYYKKRLWLQRHKSKIVASCIAVLLSGVIIISMLGIKKDSVTKDNVSKSSQNQENRQNDAEAQYQLGLMYEQGKNVKKDYKKAIEYYEKAGNLGHTEAQYSLGIMYFSGRGKEVHKDYKKAFVWLEKAGNQGHVQAQKQLGDIYYYGNGLKQDYSKACEWYEKAAIQGHAEAQNQLGIMYFHAQGVKQDYKKSFEWFKISSEQKYAGAQLNAGLMYYNGHGVQQDKKKAIDLLERSAQQGNSGAQFYLGGMYLDGREVKQDIAKAIYLLEKSANQGNADSQGKLGLMYKDGQGVTKDEEKAIYWLEKAAKQDNSHAQHNLALIYWDGMSSAKAKDFVKARYWFEKSANHGAAAAQYLLACMYQKGLGIGKDEKKAAYWYEKCIEQEHNGVQHYHWYAKLYLGLMYYNGQGVKKDIKKAIDLIERSAKQNYKPAQFELANIYYNGKEIKQDLEKAKYWYEQAAKQGHNGAKAKLNEILKKK